MIYFFGVLSPGRWARRRADEASAKANFFGGPSDAAMGAVPMSRAEQDACYLYDKAPEPIGSEGADYSVRDKWRGRF